MSLLSAARIADVSSNTVAKLLADAGRVCSAYQDQALRDLPCKRIQCDAPLTGFVTACLRR